VKQVQTTICGVSPLLMNRFPMEPVEGLQKMPAEQQARVSLYERDGAPFVPGVNVHRMLISAAGYSKGKGRATLGKIASAALFVDEAELPLGDAMWVVDSRPVVIAATKGRIVRHRPRFDSWQVSFTISYDETLLTETQVRRIVDDGGQRVGLLDFRPEKKGSFGRFKVVEWQS
jgi:hypothetical protein